MREPRFHYVLELWPVLVPVALLALVHIDAKRLFVVFSLTSIFLLSRDPIESIRDYGTNVPRVSEIRQFLRTLPAKDAVMADESAGPWIANRLYAYRAPEFHHPQKQCPDWMVFPSHKLKEYGKHRCFSQMNRNPRMIGEWTVIGRRQAE